jgi:hypothetical protein
MWWTTSASFDGIGDLGLDFGHATIIIRLL